MLVMNWYGKDSKCDYHVDVNDFKGGYCVVTCWGDFEGGNLEFPELGISIALRPRDVIFFKSSHLSHGTSAVKGIRCSIVLTTHANVFYADVPWVHKDSEDFSDLYM